MHSIWTSFGLRANPFFQDALSPLPGSAYPVSRLLVGRSAELDQALRLLGRDAHRRVIIEGAPGVGTSSFASRVKLELDRRRVSTNEVPVRIGQFHAFETVITDVLRLLLRLRNSNTGRGDRTFWQGILRLVDGHEHQVSASSLSNALRQALQHLTRTPASRVLVHLDAEGAGNVRLYKLAILLRDMRDCFTLPGASWLITAPAGTRTALFREHSRTCPIFPAGVALRSLKPNEVALLLEARYTHLRIGTRYTPPVEPVVAARLYERFRGDLRSFLRILSDASEVELGVRRTEPLSVERILKVMRSRRAGELREWLAPVDREHLTNTLVKAAGSHEFRVTDVAQRTGLTQPSASVLVGRLRSKGAIVVSRTAGRSTYYRPVSDVIIALGLAAR